MSWLLILPCVSFFIGPLPTIPSQFEVGSSSAAVPDDVMTFLARFDQPEVNDPVWQTSGLPVLLT